MTDWEVWEGARVWKRKNWPTQEMLASLLRCAGVPANQENQKQLCERLRFASNVYRFAMAEQHQIPQKAYDTAAAAAKKLLSAMGKLNRYARPRIKPRRGPDGGDIDTDEFDWLNESDRDGAERFVKKVLAAVDRKSPDFAGSPKRGKPPSRAKYVVVGNALAFLRDRAMGGTQPAKMRLSQKHLEFIELFYETVTGEEDARGKLEWQIREWLKSHRRLESRRV